MSFEDCKRKGLIKKYPEANKRIAREFSSAEHFLKSGSKVFKIKEYDLVIISCYNSCFHFLRACLFKKGFIEKSHYCLIEALRFLHKEDKIFLDLLNEFDKIRMSRHEIQYRGIFSDKDEAEYVLDFNERLKKFVLDNFR